MHRCLNILTFTFQFEFGEFTKYLFVIEHQDILYCDIFRSIPETLTTCQFNTCHCFVLEKLEVKGGKEESLPTFHRYDRVKNLVWRWVTPPTVKILHTALLSKSIVKHCERDLHKTGKHTIE